QREFDELREIDQATPKLHTHSSTQPPSKGKAKQTVPDDDASTESDDNQDLDTSRSFIKPPTKTQPIPDDLSTDSEDEIQDITAIVQEKSKQKEKNVSEQRSSSSKLLQPPPVDIKDESTASESEKNAPNASSVPSSSVTPTSTQVGNTATQSKPKERPPVAPSSTCKICSLENETTAAMCAACSHVLNPALMPNCWRCTSTECQSVGYINLGDYGVCGLCGSTKPR
ncbi:hypothetical protein KCU73_g15444, partial [Aureobasidium melanogenum]